MSDEPKAMDPTEPTTAAEHAGPGQPDEMDRRRFLNGAWKTLGVVLIAEGVWTTYDLLNPKAAEGAGVIDAGPVSDFMDEGTVRYFLNGRFYVTNHEGGLRALYQKCPHLGCGVPFCSTSQQFECPCHGSVYNLIGEYLRGPAARGMDRFEIRIQDDRVIVDTGSLVLGPPRGELTGPSEPAGPSCVSTEGGASTGSGATGG